MRGSTRANDSATERYRYLYDREQLAWWAERIAALARRTERVHVIFNNCHGNYATANAAELRWLLTESGSR